MRKQRSQVNQLDERAGDAQVEREHDDDYCNDSVDCSQIPHGIYFEALKLTTINLLIDPRFAPALEERGATLASKVAEGCAAAILAEVFSCCMSFATSLHSPRIICLCTMPEVSVSVSGAEQS